MPAIGQDKEVVEHVTEESDCELETDYTDGGYHEAILGEIYATRYRIEFKLGWGHFSTVYLASDLTNCPPTPVALKFQKSSAAYHDAALDEVDILRTIRAQESSPNWKNRSWPRNRLILGSLAPSDDDSTGIIQYIDSFEHRGANGKHIVMVFEALGPNLLTMMRAWGFKGIPVNMCRRISAQVMNGLDFLHNCCKVIHTDLKPENVLISCGEWPHSVLEVDWNCIAPEYDEEGNERRNVLAMNSPFVKAYRKKLQEYLESHSYPQTPELAVDLVKERLKGKDSTSVSLSNPSPNTYTNTNTSSYPVHRRRAPRPSCPPPLAAGAEAVESLCGGLYDYWRRNAEDKVLKKDNSLSMLESHLVYLSKHSYPFWNARNTSDSTNVGLIEDTKLVSSLGYRWYPSDPDALLLASPAKLKHVPPDHLQQFLPFLLSRADYEIMKKSKTASKKIYYSCIGPINIKAYWHKLLLDCERPYTYKIVDLGNACWVDQHFSEGIQTRQYRCPEVITLCPYGESSDLWSFATMLFELRTGDFLFEPRSDSKQQWSRDEDHLALIAELLGPLPRSITQGGKSSAKMFDQVTNHLLQISDLKYWGLSDVLNRRSAENLGGEQDNFCDFLLPFLALEPMQRCSTVDGLRHPWLKMNGISTLYLAPELRASSPEQQFLSRLQLFELPKSDANIRIVIMRQGFGAFPMRALAYGGLPSGWIETLENYPIVCFIPSDRVNGKNESASMFPYSYSLQVKNNEQLSQHYAKLIEDPTLRENAARIQHQNSNLVGFHPNASSFDNGEI